jgi:hypothetical protein
LNTKEIAKAMREDFKTQLKGVKISVRTEYYSMGSAIHVSIMKAPFAIIQPFELIPKDTLEKTLIHPRNRWLTIDNFKDRQKEGYAQINHNQFSEDREYDPDTWNNGVFLSKEGFELLRKITLIVRNYHIDRSDIQTDYYDVNFSFHLNIGKWNKPVEVN